MVFDSLSISTEKVLRNKAEKTIRVLSSTFLCRCNALALMIPREMKSGQFRYQEIGQIFRTWIEELLLTVEALEHI